MSTPHSIKFRRQSPGVYFGYSEVHGFRIAKPAEEDGRWVVEVKEAMNTAGVIHTLSQPLEARCTTETLAEARRVVAEFVATVGGTTKWGLQHVLDKAAVAVVNEDIARMRATPQLGPNGYGGPYEGASPYGRA